MTAGFHIPAYVVLVQISLLTFLPRSSETLAKILQQRVEHDQSDWSKFHSKRDEFCETQLQLISILLFVFSFLVDTTFRRTEPGSIIVCDHE